MKDNFRTKLRGFLGTDHTKKILDQNIESQSMLLLQPLMPENSYLPYTIWGMLPRTIIHILNDIVINRRTNIIEFGSGISTYFIARLIQLNDLDTKFISVDSNPDWISHQRSILKKEGLNSVELVHAPLKTSKRTYKSNSKWYDEDAITPHLTNEVDLVIVDGPETDESPYIRHHAVPFIKDFLSTGGAVFLDDTHRHQEREILQDWAVYLGRSVFDHKFYGLLAEEGSFNIDSIAKGAYYYE